MKAPPRLHYPDAFCVEFHQLHWSVKLFSIPGCLIAALAVIALPEQSIQIYRKMEKVSTKTTWQLPSSAAECEM